jgi:CMP-N-acetylneuraminic acid synthetase
MNNTNIRKNGKITVIIPVREGSSRCIQKNFRPFGNTNLLEKKIKQLKELQKLEIINEIIVSTESEKMLNIARKNNVTAIKRDLYYAQTDTKGKDLFPVLAKCVKTPIMIYTHCVAPFSKNEDLINMINIFRNNNTHTSVVTSQKVKKHLWRNNIPINFDLNDMVKTQDLPDIYNMTYAFNIIETKLVLDGTIFGNKPYFYLTDQISSIDIDTPLDFVISELLYKNNIRNNEDLENYLNKKK